VRLQIDQPARPRNGRMFLSRSLKILRDGLRRLRKVTQACFAKMTHRNRIHVLVIDDWVGAGAPRLLGDL